MNQSQKPRQTIEPYAGLILGVVTCVLVFVNVFWLVQDTRPVPAGDENTIMAKTLVFVDRLKTYGFNLEMIDQLSDSGRPPLYQLLSVPFVLIFGRSMDSGVYVNMLFYVLLMVATYNIGKVAHSRPAGLLAAILVGTYPTMVRISHLYRSSFALAACTALTMWLLLLLVKTRSVKYAWLTSLSLAFGLFIHPTFAWGVPIPVAFVYVYVVLTDQEGGRLISIRELPGWLGRKLKQPIFLKGILPSALISVGLVLLWYFAKGTWLYDTLIYLSSPELAEVRGFDTLVMGFSYDYPPLLMYALTSPHTLSIVFAVFAGFGLISAFVKRSLSGLILAASFVFSYIVLSLQPTLGWRYFAQILPVAAVFTAIWISGLQDRRLSMIFVIISATISVFNLVFVIRGVSPNLNIMAGYLGADLGSAKCAPENALFCPDPPLHQNWPISNALKDILSDPECRAGNCILSVTSNTPFYSSLVFKYYLIQDFPGAKLTIINNGNPAQPFIYSSLLESNYILYQDFPRYENTSNIAIATRILQDDDAPLFSASHQEVARYPLPDGSTAIQIERIQPLTSAEAEEVIKAVNLTGIFSILKFKILIILYRKEGYQDKADLLCQKVLTFADTAKDIRVNIKGSLAPYCDYK